MRQQLADLTGAPADAQEALQLAPADENAVVQLASIYGETGSQRLRLTFPAGPPSRLQPRPFTLDLRANGFRQAGMPRRCSRCSALSPWSRRRSSFVTSWRNCSCWIRTSTAQRRHCRLLSHKRLTLPRQRWRWPAMASYRSYDVAEGEFKRMVAASPANPRLRLALREFYESHQRHGAGRSGVRPDHPS